MIFFFFWRGNTGFAGDICNVGKKTKPILSITCKGTTTGKTIGSEFTFLLHDMLLAGRWCQCLCRLPASADTFHCSFISISYYVEHVNTSYSSFRSVVQHTSLTGSTSSVLFYFTLRYLVIFALCALRCDVLGCFDTITESPWTYLSSLLSTSAYWAIEVLFCDQHCLNFILFTTKILFSLFSTFSWPFLL